MKLEIGTVVIVIVVFLITFFVFERKKKETVKGRFIYWLMSTIVMAPLLFVWFVYNEPAALSPMGGLISIGLAGIFSFGRSYLIAMLP